MEETGYEAPKFLEMYAGNNLTAYLEGTLHLYFAKDCQGTERRPDLEEIQAVERMSVTQALSSARAGDVEAAGVTLAILIACAQCLCVSAASIIQRRPLLPAVDCTRSLPTDRAVPTVARSRVV